MGLCASGPGLPDINPSRVDESHFEVYRVVGRGAFGKVNAVLHRPSGEVMAMKTMWKDVVLKERQQKVIWLERNLMASFKCPFLVNLKYSFQTEKELFLIMPFMQGGDLHYYLDTRGRMSEADCKFYLAEMILGLEEIHSLGYIYRDLKPANVLLDEQGHLRISDFGLAKRMRKSKGYAHNGFAGTRGYTAAEMVAGGDYSFGADFWSLGIVLFELLHGKVPFRKSDDIMHSELEDSDFAGGLSAEARDLIRGLLAKVPDARLGCLSASSEEERQNAFRLKVKGHRSARIPGGMWSWAPVKQHPWFSDINWEDIRQRNVNPPFEPELGVANCSPQFEAEDQLLADHNRGSKINIAQDDQKAFNGFSFNVEVKDMDMDGAAELEAATPIAAGGPMSPPHSRVPTVDSKSDEENSVDRKSNEDEEDILTAGSGTGTGAGVTTKKQKDSVVADTGAPAGRLLSKEQSSSLKGIVDEESDNAND